MLAQTKPRLNSNRATNICFPKSIYEFSNKKPSRATNICSKLIDDASEPRAHPRLPDMFANHTCGTDPPALRAFLAADSSSYSLSLLRIGLAGRLVVAGRSSSSESPSACVPMALTVSS